jgi:hypothetical protein
LAECTGGGAANIDLDPTILRAAGEPIPEAMDGRALQDGARRERILFEGWEGSGATQKWTRIWTTGAILGRDRGRLAGAIAPLRWAGVSGR